MFIQKHLLCTLFGIKSYFYILLSFSFSSQGSFFLVLKYELCTLFGHTMSLDLNKIAYFHASELNYGSLMI